VIKKEQRGRREKDREKLKERERGDRERGERGLISRILIFEPQQLCFCCIFNFKVQLCVCIKFDFGTEGATALLRP